MENHFGQMEVSQLRKGDVVRGRDGFLQIITLINRVRDGKTTLVTTQYVEAQMMVSHPKPTTRRYLNRSRFELVQRDGE